MARRLPHSPLLLLYGTLLSTILALLAGCTPPGGADMRWEVYNGPYAREITALLPLGGTQNRLVAGMLNGDVYYSASLGTQWERRAPADPGSPLHRLVQHPDTPSCILACTGGGLFLSRDTSRSWHRIAITDGGRPLPVYCIAFDPWRNRTMYAGTGGRGVYRSSDNGSTWAPANGKQDSLLRKAEVFDILIDPDRPDRIAAAIGTRGLALSENSAEEWTQLIEGQSAVATAVTHVRIQPGTTPTILYATDAGSIYRSSNRGSLWSPSREGTAGDRIRSLVRIPSQPQALLAGTETGIIMSTDFGDRWRPVTTALPATGISLVLGAGSPARWYAFGPAIGLQTSADEGRTWTSIDAHLAGATPGLIALDPTTGETYAAFGSTLLKTASRTAVWTNALSAMAGGTITWCAFDRLQSRTAYVSTAMGAFRTEDNGATWEQFARRLPTQPIQLVAHPWFASRLLSATAAGNYYSTDRGSTWRECQAFSKTPPARTFAFRHNDAGAVYAAAGARGVLLSSDGGISWDATRYGLEQDTIELVSLDRDDRTMCYAWSARGRCFRSLNGGLEWDRYTPPWEPGDRVLLALDPLSSSDLVALANNQTLYVTGDGGTTWMQIPNCSIPAPAVALSWSREMSRLVAGTRHNGIYAIDLAAALRARDRE